MCLTKCFGHTTKDFPGALSHSLLVFPLLAYPSWDLKSWSNLSPIPILLFLTFYSLKYISHFFMYFLYTHKHLISKLYPSRLLELQTSLLISPLGNVTRASSPTWTKVNWSKPAPTAAFPIKAIWRSLQNMAILVECSSLWDT